MYFADSITCLKSVFVYPISLSYQAKTFTKFPSTTLVNDKSAIEAYGLPTISLETKASSVTLNIPAHLGFCASFFKI